MRATPAQRRSCVHHTRIIFRVHSEKRRWCQDGTRTTAHCPEETSAQSLVVHERNSAPQGYRPLSNPGDRAGSRSRLEVRDLYKSGRKVRDLYKLLRQRIPPTIQQHFVCPATVASSNDLGGTQANY